uniref:Gustatory receptor n=1 Tax=Tetranychus urticae TaxID=32264 RepID=T1KRK2_TETUR
MDEIKSNHCHSQTEPSSLLGCSLLRKNVFSQVVFWIASITLVSKAVYRLYLVIITPIDVSEPTNFINRYELILDQLYPLCLGLIIMHFEVNRSLYIEYLDCYHLIVSNHFGKASLGFVKKWVKIIRFWVIVAFIYEVITTLTNNYLRYFKKFGFTVNMFAILSIGLIGQLSYILAIQFMIECCIYCQSTFIPINTLLDTLSTRNKLSSPLDINRIAKSTRVYYIKTIRSIRYMDRFLAYAIFVFYLYFIGHCIFIFSSTLKIGSSPYLLFYSVFRFFGESSYLVLVTYHLIRVNQLSVQIFDKVYQFSFSFNSEQSIVTVNEINLFLLRIHPNDVGFTFAGLCLVSPSFVSSLVTISLTLGLALPSIIK